MSHTLPDFESRRRFVKSASAFALALPAMPLVISRRQNSPTQNLLDGPRPAQIEIADRQEPSVRILLQGTVFNADGAPASNVKIYVYHTDAAGYYSRPVNNPRQPRLHGTVWSDAKGRYAISTIKPAHYARVQQPPPMHIHIHLQPQDLPDHWVDSYYFQDDAYLQPDDIARARGLARFSNIVRLTPGEPGVLRAVRDFRVDPALAARNQLLNGWYRQ